MIVLLAGATDTSIDVQIVDDTGLPVTGLVAATFPTIKYSKGTGADTTITLSDLSALTDAHSDGGVKERGEGVYRLDLTDAVSSAVAPAVKIRGEATNKRVISPEIQVASATRGLAGTALPNAAADAAGGLPISDAGGLDLDAKLDVAVGTRMASYTQPTGFLAATFPSEVASRTNITAGTIATVGTLTNAPSDSSGVTTLLSRLTGTRAGYLDNLSGGAVALASGVVVASISANAITAAAIASDAVAEIQSGLATATSLGAVADYLDTEIAAILAVATKLDTALENDGAGGYQFTTLALANGPSGGGGGGDATEAKQDTIIAALGVIDGIVDDILTDTGTTIPSAISTLQTSVNDVPTNSEFTARSLASADYFVVSDYTAPPSAATVASQVRTELTTELGRIDAAVTTRATPAQVAEELVTYDGPTNAEMIARSLASADYATATNLAAAKAVADAIKLKTDNLPASPAAVGSAMVLTSGERDSVAAAMLDLAAGIETGLTLRQAMRLLAAASAGKLSGAATTTIVIRNAAADSKDRITATVDADGNRSAITLDLS